MSKSFEVLSNDDDVVSVSKDIRLVVSHTTFTVEEFAAAIREHLRISDPSSVHYSWVGEGVECRLLQAGSNHAGWRTGKVRIHLEFCPDDEPTPEPETILEQTESSNYTESLDGIRQEIAHNS
jgi:KGK domain